MSSSSSNASLVEKPCSACSWTPFRQDSCRYDSHVKLFYGVETRGAWSLGSRYILKERDAGPPNFETANIEFLRKNTKIPLPEIVRAWEEDGRYFEILSRIRGRTLRDTWPFLTQVDVERIAAQTAVHIAQIRKLTSERMESLGGEPLFNAFLFDAPSAPHGPFDTDDALFSEMISLLDVPAEVAEKLRSRAPPCEPYTFTHGDLTDCNIIVDEGNLSGIIDFENSGYYPVWWESVKCSIGFTQEDASWKTALQKEIQAFPEAYQWWRAYMILQYNFNQQDALDILETLPETYRRE
ncbi:kinase-like domain-containing protein [Hypoxylon crocopeplum]|nr:kinase-like domain-containing protein [Hypoxylon crocopeplum]